MTEKELRKAINDFTKRLTLNELNMASEIIADRHYRKQRAASIARLKAQRERTAAKFFANGGTIPDPIER